ncbi:hypothetical protein [Natrinema salaciae]|uniref:Uncharacterized protein n=1 Tax=Natrinema salaciae TaxID=1186196 RepID=A0A1H9PQG1_9EURY|nr:hypothetical protein [Natrinema salaciae]SER50320.1 hypothetical protein SAMN04489841_3940 [Natrinema salaciae]
MNLDEALDILDDGGEMKVYETHSKRNCPSPRPPAPTGSSNARNSKPHET